ncbi:MAG: DUF1829 domain-containing protein [Caldilineales bacterium]|nr:DUF1829 domain-containing protein [Caldilineales bacterium]
MDDIRQLIEQYTSWLNDRTHLRQIEDWVEITTPYLDRHNDDLQIFAKSGGGRITLSDDGYIIRDLRLSGCDLDTPKRKQLLKIALNGFGVQLKGDVLTVDTNASNFSQQKHNLIQAMIAINDMFYLAVPMVRSVFLEDVTEWMDLHEIRYISQVKFTGSSGYDHVFDFVIPKSRQMPERILKAINRPSRETAESFAWGWIDTREVRSPDSRAYAFLNDSERAISSDVTDALTSYEIVPISWQQRDRYRAELAM